MSFSLFRLIPMPSGCMENREFMTPASCAKVIFGLESPGNLASSFKSTIRSCNMIVANVGRVEYKQLICQFICYDK